MTLLFCIFNFEIIYMYILAYCPSHVFSENINEQHFSVHTSQCSLSWSFVVVPVLQRITSWVSITVFLLHYLDFGSWKHN